MTMSESLSPNELAIESLSQMNWRQIIIFAIFLPAVYFYHINKMVRYFKKKVLIFFPFEKKNQQRTHKYVLSSTGFQCAAALETTHVLILGPLDGVQIDPMTA